MNENNKHIFNNIIFPFFLSMCSASYIKTKNKAKTAPLLINNIIVRKEEKVKKRASPLIK